MKISDRQTMDELAQQYRAGYADALAHTTRLVRLHLDQPAHQHAQSCATLILGALEALEAALTRQAEARGRT